MVAIGVFSEYGSGVYGEVAETMVGGKIWQVCTGCSLDYVLCCGCGRNIVEVLWRKEIMYWLCM